MGSNWFVSDAAGRPTPVIADYKRSSGTGQRSYRGRDWITLSARAVDALRRRARRYRAEALTGAANHDQGLVFCRPNGCTGVASPHADSSNHYSGCRMADA
jgi:hypothetical protein